MQSIKKQSVHKRLICLWKLSISAVGPLDENVWQIQLNLKVMNFIIKFKVEKKNVIDQIPTFL